MKYVSVCLSVLFLLFIANIKIVAQDKEDSEQISSLKSRIENLEKLVEEQGKKISELTDEVNTLKKQKPMVAFPNMPDKKGKPKNGMPFEFNGETYYIVPLQTDSKSINNYQNLK